MFLLTSSAHVSQARVVMSHAIANCAMRMLLLTVEAHVAIEEIVMLMGLMHVSCMHYAIEMSISVTGRALVTSRARLFDSYRTVLYDLAGRARADPPRPDGGRTRHAGDSAQDSWTSVQACSRPSSDRTATPTGIRYGEVARVVTRPDASPPARSP